MNYFTKSKIFLYFCLSFSLGVFAASFIKIPVLALYAILIGTIILASLFWQNKKAVVAGFCLIFIILGAWRFQAVSESIASANDFENLDKNIIFQGLVAEEPDVRIKNTQYVIQTQSSNVKTQNFIRQPAEQSETAFYSGDKNAGKILATLPHYPAYQYGDLIEFEGKLKLPAIFDSFNYREYLAKDNISFVIYFPKTRLISSGNGSIVCRTIFGFKNAFKKQLKNFLPEPEISLLNGLLLGEKSGMSEKLKNDFSATGTSHIVAVSGFNVTIVALIILELSLLVGLSRKQSFWISLAAIVLFVIMVGAPASAIRAGIMSGLLMAAMRLGRLNTIFIAIVFAATLMIAANPKILRFDVGFQLSFLAVMGLVWIYPLLAHWLKKIPDYLKIKSMFLLTISAQIMALPVLIYNFDRLSMVAPLANILILPFIPLAMAIGFLAGLFSFIWIAPAKLIGYFAWFILAYQIRTIEYLASLPWASLEIFNFNLAMFAGYYLIAAMIVIWFEYKKSL